MRGFGGDRDGDGGIGGKGISHGGADFGGSILDVGPGASGLPVVVSGTVTSRLGRVRVCPETSVLLAEAYFSTAAHPPLTVLTLSSIKLFKIPSTTRPSSP